ncbi:MAG: hypothetical protein WCO64_04795, partial [Actinomycetes bacterium]
EMLIRGICSLRPGVVGLSENITVRSILGRFLEHSRVYEFGNAGDCEVWIGSADLMHRNLDRRVEVLVRLNKADSASITETLDLAFAESTAAWHLSPDGSWTRVHRDTQGQPLNDYQEQLIRSHPVARLALDEPTPRVLANILTRVGIRGR